jgi:hypothetical protein
MTWTSPIGLIALGFLLVVAGFIGIFFMVIRVIEPGFFLSFLSYGASFMGLMLGIIGISQYTTGGQNDF